MTKAVRCRCSFLYQSTITLAILVFNDDNFKKWLKLSVKPKACRSEEMLCHQHKNDHYYIIPTFFCV